MRTNYTVRLVRFLTFAVLSLLFAGRALADGTLANFFGASTSPTWGIDIYMYTTQAADAGKFNNFPMGIADANDPNSNNVNYAEVGEVQDCTPGHDCARRPYFSSQDGAYTTHYEFVDTSHTLGTGMYEWKVIHNFTRAFSGYFCYGSPILCIQEGNTLFSASHDSYLYTAAGYETPDSNPFIHDIHYRYAQLETTSGVWNWFCPNTELGSGTINAAITPCNGDTVGFRWDIVFAGVARMPFVGSNY